MMKRRTFLQSIVLSGAAIAAEKVKAESKQAFKAQAGFTLWQLPSQVNTIGNSYVLLTNKGQVIVMDGGVKDEAPYLRGFLSALGGEVEAWYISHPHDDHMGALNAILKEPLGIRIRHIYHSRFSESLIETEKPYNEYCKDFYQELDKTNIPVTDLRESGMEQKYGGMNLKILGVVNEEFRTNPYNNSSVIIRVWDKKKSVVFLGDAGVECGNKVLHGAFRGDLDCDYLQVAHHGQRGCDEHFYKTIHFRSCLWPTPTWVWNNDGGGGINTAHLKTFETRQWMDEIGIKEHHVSCLEGLWRLV